MKKSVLSIVLIMLLLFAGCGRTELSEDVSSTLPVAENTTISESTTISEENSTETTTNKSSDSDTTTKPADTKSAGQSTTVESTTAKQTTTQKAAVSTTKSQTTTKKVTTTQKQTTTKKVTTTAAPYWCDEGGSHHIVDVGQIGWVDTYEQATDKALEYIASHDASGNFRVQQCLWCGKYTAEVTLR